jgi:hypothetical protein
MIRGTVNPLEGEKMDALEHPLRKPVRRRPLNSLLLALMAIAVPAAFIWMFYGRFEWLVIVLSEIALAYALVATLGRIAPPPGATPPAHSVDQ